MKYKKPEQKSVEVTEVQCNWTVCEEQSETKESKEDFTALLGNTNTLQEALNLHLALSALIGLNHS